MEDLASKTAWSLAFPSWVESDSKPKQNGGRHSSNLDLNCMIHIKSLTEMLLAVLH